MVGITEADELREHWRAAYELPFVGWEVPDFSVDRYFDRLLDMHALIEAEGHLDVGFHQFLVVARKPAG